MRALNRLTVKQIERAVPGKLPDGGGLWLHKREDSGAQWFLRVTIYGRRREMGLGPYPPVSLAEARRAAEGARALVRAGVDPIKDRDRQRREAVRNLHILADVAQDAFEARKAELKGDGAAGRWFSPIELQVLPKLGKVPVAEIDQVDIRDTLAPIWHTKAETADKAFGRLAIIMRHAAALGLPVDLQATGKARALLGKPRHIAKHIPAMDWRDVPGFYVSLDDGSVTQQAQRHEGQDWHNCGFPGAAVHSGAGAHCPGSPPCPRWMAVPKCSQGCHFGRDDEQADGTPRHGSPPARLPHQLARLAGRGH